MRAWGRRRGHRGHGPRGPVGRANFQRWARGGPLVDRGMEKVRDPRNSTAAEKVKAFRIGLESEGAAKDQLTVGSHTPSKIATKTSWNWRKNR